VSVEFGDWETAAYYAACTECVWQRRQEGGSLRTVDDPAALHAAATGHEVAVCMLSRRTVAPQ